MFNIRSDKDEESISKLEDKSKENIQTKTQKDVWEILKRE